ncbi:hypothetical protein Ancab_034626 [Ancistrocladus abbreviatus]
MIAWRGEWVRILPEQHKQTTIHHARIRNKFKVTVVLQTEQVQGLQVIKDEKWVPVDPIPNAFVINVGDQLQVLSNGRYKSVHHRVVTNKDKTRISMAMFCGPNMDTIIGPMEELIDDQHPLLYRSYRFSEFMEEFHRQEGTRRRVKEAFELHN